MAVDTETAQSIACLFPTRCTGKWRRMFRLLGLWKPLEIIKTFQADVVLGCGEKKEMCQGSFYIEAN